MEEKERGDRCYDRKRVEVEQPNEGKVEIDYDQLGDTPSLEQLNEVILSAWDGDQEASQWLLTSTVPQVDEWFATKCRVDKLTEIEAIGNIAENHGMMMEGLERQLKKFDEMGSGQGDCVEEILIQRVKMAWLRVQKIEKNWWRFDGQISPKRDEFIDTRLGKAERQFNSSLTKLTQYLRGASGIQVNVAAQQVNMAEKQVNISR